MAVSAQNNNSSPQYTCPTGISPSSNSQSTKKTEVTSCETTTAKVAGNGVTRTTCNQTNSDGSTTKTTTTCVSSGAKVSFGVGEVGKTKQTCVKETETKPGNR